MASVLKYLIDAKKIGQEIQRREDDAEKNRRKEYVYAQTIQRWVRGFLERKHLKHLHYSALTIQRHWRGYCGRKEYRRLLKEAVDEMYRKYYFKKATCIQKWWRGYCVRSKIFSYYALKRWILVVMLKNEEVLLTVKSFGTAEESSTLNILNEEARLWVLFILFKLHHLIRTYELPGIYSLLYTKELSVLEEQLKKLNYNDYVAILHRQRKAMRARYAEVPRSPPPEGTPHYNCEAFWKNRTRVNQPSIVATEKYKGATELRRERKKEDPLKISSKPMIFPRVKYDDRNMYLKPEPYGEPHTLEAGIKSIKCDIQKEFVTRFRPNEVFEHLKTFEYGPFRQAVESRTTLLLRKYEEKCVKSRKQKQ